MEGEVGARMTPTSCLYRKLSRGSASSTSEVPSVGKGWEWNSVMRVADEGSHGAKGKVAAADEQSSRPAKRVRAGSPGETGSCCQVEDCKVDLSNAKDYNRRHKVCDVHSKSAQALVAKTMQRFCQQCSRFHLLAEFDGEKRSCRSRLDCHNRRRRKILQPEDSSSSRLVTPVGRYSDDHIVRRLLARLQENSEELATNSSALPEGDKYNLIDVLSKMNSTSPTNSSVNTVLSRCFDLNVPQDHQSSGHNSGDKGTLSVPSTIDLLPIFSTPLKDSSAGDLNADKSSNKVSDSTTDLILKHTSTSGSSFKNFNIELQPIGNGKGHYPYQSSLNIKECADGDVGLTLSLQMSDTVDDNKLQISTRKYLNSEQCSHLEKMPSSHSNDYKKTCPSHDIAGNLEHERLQISTDNIPVTTENTNVMQSMPLYLSSELEGRILVNPENQELPSKEISSSLSDHSQSSSNPDSLERTNRIIFKLSNKQPSDIPEALRTQILNWLSHCPSELETYIRPGCVVLSIYVSMSLISWNKLQEDLGRVDLLLQSPGTNFWGSGTFLIQIDQKLVSYEDGKANFCKSWKKCDYPELMLVSPLAVVSGKETLLSLSGRNLTIPGTRIHCTYMGGYISKQVPGSTYCSSLNNHNLESFRFPGESHGSFGRCYIEVENCLRGDSFPVIVADDSICRELRDLEPELEDISSATDHAETHSRENIMHFLNELGWLFQKSNIRSVPILKDFSNTRFKFLLAFAIERDWLALVKKLLDMLLEKSSSKIELITECMLLLSQLQLLHRAVKRKCKKMVDMLLHYFIDSELKVSRLYLFAPNHKGPFSFTPLHLAASIEGSEHIVDSLTSDPQEIGLRCWNTLRDDNGETPSSYASTRNNHSYNNIVSRKLMNKRNGELSITIAEDEISSNVCLNTQTSQAHDARITSTSCTRCIILEKRIPRRALYSRSLIFRPFTNALLAIAAVSACVCLMLRGRPELKNIGPFEWSNLGYGSM